ncbi:DNA helicase [Spironucleus salmonicida]|uniref:DNA helicase n=1 Tax=Spironucleus salmonicida TaxID=348837 RepID=V6LRV1_9EUKA|nr:DNA helicase [Spironucleus salmonicida]|eukprot:EST43509.1 DNA helicase [Spironucleus salmonicida]
MLSKEFFEDNELGIDLERNAEILQTPLPVGFISPNQNYPQINLHPTYPLNVLLSSGKALKNLVISQISPDIEGKTSAVTFDLNQVCTFRSRDLVFIFSSKLVLLTRGTILSVNKLTVKVLPEQDFADFNDSQHFVLTKAGSEVTSKRNMTSLKQLSDQNPHASIFTLHPFFQQISTKLLDFPSLNASQTAAASKIAQIGHKQLLVIQGPPGTGKTTTLAAGIEMYRNLHPGHRILITAASNTAVDNLLVRTRGLRLGSVARATPETEHFLLENVILATKKVELKEMRKDVAECQKQLQKAQKSQAKTGERADYITSRNALRQALKTLNQAMKSFKNEVFDAQKIVACTLSTAATLRETFDLVVVDEAGQALDAGLAAAVVACHGGLVLCGDPRQLSATILDDNAKRLTRFAVSALRRLCKMTQKDFDFVLLDISYRFGSLICEFPSLQFYENKLRSGGEKAVQNQVIDDVSIVFVDTAGCDYFEERGEGVRGGSLKNTLEGELVAKIVNLLLQKTRFEDIGVIAPYSAQVALLREKLEDSQVEIHTIDGFQGREKDVIVMSMTRSNEDQQVGFLEDYKRLNVSMTRAKQQLIVVGDSQTLDGGKVLSQWVAWMMDNVTVISATEYE